MSHRPTAEQAAIVDASTTGEDLVVEAGAGTGKTSTLQLLADANPRRKGIYLAFNKAIAADASRRFPRTVQCKTSHSLAFQAVGRQYAHRLKAPRMPARETARALRINDPVKIVSELGPLAPTQLARIAMQTVERFCYSGDQQVEAWHVPRLEGLAQPLARQALASVIIPYARRAWEDLTRLDGQLRYTHDCYLKMWALSGPRLPVDFLLLDEAQDSNGALAGVVDAQDAQRILVGDRSQAIYGWRGAVDAMATFQGRRLQLSQSFRFGPSIAGEANKWLAILDAPLRLTGHEPIRSEVVSLPLPDGPDAVLCRTNAEAVRQAATAIMQGIKPALVGGGDDVRRLAEAAIDLIAGRGTAHPELMAFSSWGEVLDYVMQDSSGSDLQVAVSLIEKFKPEGVLQILEQLVDEQHADVVLSTAHKAKGREWPRIRIADDFREPRRSEDNPDPDLPRADAMLAYVAVTRAQEQLDRYGLEWVDRWAPKHLIDRPSAAAVHEGNILEDRLRTIAAREVPPAVVATATAVAVDIDWPEPVPVVDEPPADLPPAPEQPVDPGDGLSPDCKRCGHHYTACTCTLMPDRRRLTAATR